MAKIWRFSFVSHTDTLVTVVNDLHYQSDLEGIESEPSATDIVEDLDTKLRTAYKACLPNSSTLDSAELREEVAPGSASVPGAATITINQQGTLTQTSPTLPDALTAIVKLRSDAAIRSGRGYVAMPSPRVIAALGSSRQWDITSTWWANLVAFAALLDDVVVSGNLLDVNMRPVVYSRTRHARGQSPYTFNVVEAVPRRVPSWRRSRMTAP